MLVPIEWVSKLLLYVSRDARTRVTLKLTRVPYLENIHSYYDKKGRLKDFGLLLPCNLDSGKCQKNKYRKLIRNTSIVVWVRT